MIDANVATLSLNIKANRVEITQTMPFFFSYLPVPDDPIFLVKNVGVVNILFELVSDDSSLVVTNLTFAVWDDVRSTGSWITLTPNGSATEHGIAWTVVGDQLQLTFTTSSQSWVAHCRFAATATIDGKTFVVVLDPKIYNDGSPPG